MDREDGGKEAGTVRYAWTLEDAFSTVSTPILAVRGFLDSVRPDLLNAFNFEHLKDHVKIELLGWLTNDYFWKTLAEQLDEGSLRFEHLLCTHRTASPSH